MRRGGLRLAASAALAAALLLGGCADGGEGGLSLPTPVPTGSVPASAASPDARPATAAPSSASSATAAPVGGAEEQRVLAQYRRFFALITPIALAPAAQRSAMFAEVATEPSFSHTLSRMAAADKAGEIPYGEVVLNPAVVRLTTDLATIEDCQDTSANGRRKKSDGTKLTVGRKGAPVLATMKRGPDRIWRVSRVDYQAGLKC